MYLILDQKVILHVIFFLDILLDMGVVIKIVLRKWHQYNSSYLI